MKDIKDNKPIAKIGNNGLIYFYNPDGNRNLNHPTGFCFPGCIEWLKNNNYKVVSL